MRLFVLCFLNLWNMLKGIYNTVCGFILRTKLEFWMYHVLFVQWLQGCKGIPLPYSLYFWRWFSHFDYLFIFYVKTKIWKEGYDDWCFWFRTWQCSMQSLQYGQWRLLAWSSKIGIIIAVILTFKIKKMSIT